MHNNNYAIKSLELHLFFSRIMKEHALFLKAGFTPADAECAKKAEFFIKSGRLSRMLTILSGKAYKTVSNLDRLFFVSVIFLHPLCCFLCNLQAHPPEVSPKMRLLQECLQI